MLARRVLGTASLGAPAARRLLLPAATAPRRACDPAPRRSASICAGWRPDVIPSRVRQVFLDLTIARIPEARVAAALGARSSSARRANPRRSPTAAGPGAPARVASRPRR